MENSIIFENEKNYQKIQIYDQVDGLKVYISDTYDQCQCEMNREMVGKLVKHLNKWLKQTANPK